MNNTRIYKMSFAGVYPYYIQKAEKKGRTKDEVDSAAKVPVLQYFPFLTQIIALQRYRANVMKTLIIKFSKLPFFIKCSYIVIYIGR